MYYIRKIFILRVFNVLSNYDQQNEYNLVFCSTAWYHLLTAKTHPITLIN